MLSEEIPRVTCTRTGNSTKDSLAQGMMQFMGLPVRCPKRLSAELCIKHRLIVKQEVAQHSESNIRIHTCSSLSSLFNEEMQSDETRGGENDEEYCKK